MGEARNQGESLAHSTESSLKEHGDKIAEAEKTAIEDAIAAVREVLGKEDATAEEVNEKVQALATASMKLGEAIYASQQEGEAHADAAADAATDGDDVVDADFEEVDDENRQSA